MLERSSYGAYVWYSAAGCALALVVSCADEAPLRADTSSDDRNPDDDADAGGAGDAPNDAGGDSAIDDTAIDDTAIDDTLTGDADTRAPDDFDFDDCEQLCDELVVVGCTGPERECMLQCAVDVTSLAGTRCKALWVDMIECGRDDIEGRFECDDEGVPVLQAEVCLLEQVELLDCVRSGG